MKFQLQLIDDHVLIKTWSTAREAWDIWGAVHLDAFYQNGSFPDWYTNLRKDKVVIVRAEFTLTSM